MAAGFRYLSAEEHFKSYAFQALIDVFSSGQKFEKFYSEINSDFQKDDFLRVSTFYLFLVKSGEWRAGVDGSDKGPSYITTSYKLVSLFSLIESLSTESFVDFYQWLIRQNARMVFPISDQKRLEELYDEYKKSFGSVRKCVAFFEQLSPMRQHQLQTVVLIGGKPFKTIKKLAQFLYNLRSDFVHEGKLILAVEAACVLYLHGGKLVEVELTIANPR